MKLFHAMQEQEQEQEKTPAENRKEKRHRVFLKAVAKDISQFPGCMENLSRNGCKINFPDAGEIDFDREYAVTVYPQPNAESECFSLTLMPRWAFRTGTGALVGFSVLRDPGYASFIRYVERAAAGEEEEADMEALVD